MNDRPSRKPSQWIGSRGQANRSGADFRRMTVVAPEGWSCSWQRAPGRAGASGTRFGGSWPRTARYDDPSQRIPLCGVPSRRDHPPAVFPVVPRHRGVRGASPRAIATGRGCGRAVPRGHNSYRWRAAVIQLQGSAFLVHAAKIVAPVQAQDACVEPRVPRQKISARLMRRVCFHIGRNGERMRASARGRSPYREKRRTVPRPVR
jgi:hypothetical protein